MRLAPALLLVASLGLATLPIPITPTLVTPAAAQDIQPGGGVRIDAALGSRVNVRSSPEIQPNNVVAQASGGDLLQVEETAQRGTFTWYRIATLPDAATSYQGWIRGDLLAPAALPEQPPAEAEAPAATDSDAAATDSAAAETAPPSEPAPLPYEMRTDWSRNILTLYPAIEDCVRVNSAPPVTVLRANLRTRGSAEVIMSDAAGRRWDCIIRETGGTPMRYDPLSGSVFARDRTAREPFFTVEDDRPPLDPECYRFERVIDPATEEHLGWLYYRTCP